MGRIATLRDYLFGDRDNITLERYFVTICIFTAAVFTFIRCVFHIISGLALNSALLAGLVFVLFGGLYYAVRFLGFLFVPKVITTVGGLVFLDMAWYFQSLSKGPILFFILIFAAFVIWVWKGKHLFLFMVLYFLNLILLFSIDYNASEALVHYPNHKVRSVHIFLSLFCYAAVLIFILYTVKQEFIRQQKKAVRSEKLKTAFLANLSHEIRTPMNGILGFSGLLKNPNLTGELQRQYLGIIGRSGERMLSIINDIINISKIEAGVVHIARKEVDINEQLEYIYKFFKPEVEAKGITFSYPSSNTSEHLMIRTDPEKLVAIFINLVKNAIKYSTEGRISFGYTVVGNVVEFYVRDTGIGIAPERHKAIFERFVQAEIEDEAARQGVGLGLSIAKSYVELLGGNIWVQSQIGLGSKFTFTLPYNFISKKNKMNERKTALGEKTKGGLTLKVLIVEDDEISETLMVINVKEFCVAPLIARTGAEAVELCRAHPDLDLVLMDIQLPVFNGYEATKQIRQFNDDVVIIAQTAFGLSSDREKAMEAGCNDYISKPIDKDKLVGLIRKHLSKDTI
ncbi:ATP-binding protein [Maribacter chungangensis]|uniref:histidine kinase n=1 Tax=Maribacter chungangensis TaxID=1069117 RepID=A0ABW3B6H5_9FLAO